ncbi:MAG: M23 family metallopeptidase [Chloroflexia bacterium]|nr:M23 family metallopeptidase [Chloroflexia bacterium]
MTEPRDPTHISRDDGRIWRQQRSDRRQLLLRAAALGLIAAPRSASARGVTGPPASVRPPMQAATPAFSYPIGRANEMPGAGFSPRHGFAVENLSYLPGYWHAGEDWYATSGDTAGADVLAVAAGEVVFAGSDYPGRVVIVQHAADLFSMYGHLVVEVPVNEGERVARGDRLGSVMVRPDGYPNHLHIELRTFLTTPEVNGATPRYPFACGPDCLPGPGYWPIEAPESPAGVGWLNPTHVINRRIYPAGVVPPGAEVVATGTVASAPIWSAPEGTAGATRLGEVSLESGVRFPLRAIDAGAEAPPETSADTYHLWYRIVTPDGNLGWVQAAIPSSAETGSDGQPAIVELTLLPVV